MFAPSLIIHLQVGCMLASMTALTGYGLEKMAKKTLKMTLREG